MWAVWCGLKSLGKGTKLCDLLTDKRKTYQAVLLLGTETDTQDTTGTILSEKPTEQLTEPAVRGAAESFVGPYMQVPPMYSALKVNGKKLYELAIQSVLPLPALSQMGCGLSGCIFLPRVLLPCQTEPVEFYQPLAV